MLSLTRQSDLLGVSRSSLYYVPVVPVEDLRTIHAIDAIYTALPFYGSRRIRWSLEHEHGITICREHVQRLMRVMGIQGICPKRNLSIASSNTYKYPYLLRGMHVLRPNQVWGTDITYVRIQDGFCYLTVILDWFSRYVIAWEVSETMETGFCVRTLQSALAKATPDFHNSDQGSQFTAIEYVDVLKAHPTIRISMDGRGRCMDNIFTERLWRTVKYEDIYLKYYGSIHDVRDGLGSYFSFYNSRRPHQSLGNRTPDSVYFAR